MLDPELSYLIWARAASEALLLDPSWQVKVREILRAQMQILVNNGVRPTWENFTKYGESWSQLENLLSAEAVKRYHQLWTELYEEMNLND